jgi:lysozyme family protein
MSFEQVYEYTKAFEGGYVWDKVDTGGETFRGISRGAHPYWPGWVKIDYVKTVKGSSSVVINSYFKTDEEMNEMVEKLYREDYWQPLEGLPDYVRMKVFDTSVNTGYTREIGRAHV